MEVFLALALFIALIACWVVLPGSASTTQRVAPTAEVETTTDHQTAVRQLA